MELTLIIGLGRLLFDVAKWIQKGVIAAEKTPSLNTGIKKHEFVKQNVQRKIIDSIDNGLKERIKELPNDIKEEIKSHALSQINRSIEESVKTLKEEGLFVSDNNESKGD